MPSWYVVVNQENTVLAVYGSAMLSEVQDVARKIEHQTGLPVYVNRIDGNRPSVGQKLTFRKDRANG